MKVYENEFSITLKGGKHESKAGLYIFDGASYVIPSAFSRGFTNVSLELSEKYGCSLKFQKPLTADQIKEFRRKREAGE